MPVDVRQTLRSALNKLESEKARLDQQIGALRTALGGAADGRGATRPRRRRMSAAQRRAVSQRMKAYWASRRNAKPGGAKPAGAKPARTKAARAKEKSAEK